MLPPDLSSIKEMLLERLDRISSTISSTLSTNPSKLSLALTIALSTIFTSLAMTPPNPNPTPSSKSAPKDRVALTTTPLTLFLRRSTFTLLSLLHALIALTYPSPPFCSNPSNLSPTLFTWSRTTTLCLFLILTAVPMRLLAFAQLGPNFTFQLAPPKQLVTTGMYKYIQHPSYTAHILVLLCNGWLFLRVDGVVGCWLSGSVVRWGGWRGVGVAMVAVGGELIRRRVVDEERMLRGSFGKEWEMWHARTKRFIPFLF